MRKKRNDSGKNHRGGWKHSESSKKKISSALKGKPSWKKGKVGIMSKKSRIKLSESKKKLHLENPQIAILSGLKRRGIKPSIETRLRMSKAKKGKPIAKWTKERRIKSSLRWMGENSPNWKGGISAANRVIRMSLPMKFWREKVFKRDDYTCVICKKRGGTLNADHIKPFALFPELRFDLNNGRTLCIECHRKTDTYGITKSKVSNDKFFIRKEVLEKLK